MASEITSDIKLCKDCKYFQGYNNSWCKHPNNGLDLVDGSIKPMFCAVARGSISGMCKPEGLCLNLEMTRFKSKRLVV